MNVSNDTFMEALSGGVPSVRMSRNTVQSKIAELRRTPDRSNQRADKVEPS
jgi:hypothetical protein